MYTCVLYTHTVVWVLQPIKDGEEVASREVANREVASSEVAPRRLPPGNYSIANFVTYGAKVETYMNIGSTVPGSRRKAHYLRLLVGTHMT